MAKPKRSSSSGPKKMHKGPKRHLFKEYKPMIIHFAKAGLLDKYHDYESWCLACSARGKRDTTRGEFSKFVLLSRPEKEAYFKSIKK